MQFQAGTTWTSWLSKGILLSLLFVGSTAYAQNTSVVSGTIDDPDVATEAAEVPPPMDERTYRRYRLPLGIRAVRNGMTYQIFDLNEYKALLHMDNDLLFYETYYTDLWHRINRYEQIIKQLTLALDAADSQVEKLKIERTRLFDLWRDENKRRLEVENSFSLSTLVGWSTAAVEAAVILTLLLVGG